MPVVGELALSGDGEFEGFTVYKGYPYCEACHVRLRLPKCKRCKRSIRDNDEAVEALGGKWCWSCFVCAVSSFFVNNVLCTRSDLFLSRVRHRVAKNHLITRPSSNVGISHIANIASASYCAMRSELLFLDYIYVYSFSWVDH